MDRRRLAPGDFGLTKSAVAFVPSFSRRASIIAPAGTVSGPTIDRFSGQAESRAGPRTANNPAEHEKVAAR